VQLREALAAKKARVRELVPIIRAERLALRERLRADRKRVLEELRSSSRAARDAAREQWKRRRAEGLAEGAGEVATARAALAAERDRLAAERAADRELRHATMAHVRAERTQSDETVRGLIPTELLPLFARVARRIRGGSSESRAEALLRYAEKHPDEVFQVVEPRGVAHIEETRDAVADAARAARGQGVADFAEKRTARIERMRAKAARLGAAAESAHAQARRTANAIPSGQPILVGHHSEKRHRRDLDRIHRGFKKSFDLSNQSTALELRAERAEKGRAVFSDDPEAIEKLKEKLAYLNANRARMRAANAAIRAGGDVVGALGALGFRVGEGRKLLEEDFAGRVGFPDYALQNAAGEASRVERRIRELEERATTPAPAEVVVGDARISEAENRVRVTFPSVPPEATRRALKAAGFRWAPSVGAWQRHASPGAWYAAKGALARHAAGPGEGFGS
jgi:hypothetical protein